MDAKITPEEFEQLLPEICDEKTSHDPENWTPENRLWGHCAVVSLVAQNLFGGELMRASLEGSGYTGSHYWNKLSDGNVIDFTHSQFGDKYPANLISVIRQRSYVLSFPETPERYKLLAWRLAELMSNGNALFQDPIYKRCFDVALDSTCQKMWFGCVITHNGQVVYQGCNKTIEGLKSLCQPSCIRFSITSRTESMLGACGHAEEGMWDVIHKKQFPIDECELFIAGFYPTGLPWIKQRVEHTCLRCSVQMHNARIKNIYVPVGDRWRVLSTEKALETALAYATQEKKV